MKCLSPWIVFNCNGIVNFSILVSEDQLQHNASSIGSSFVGQQTNFVQRINVENYLIAKQQIAFNNNPNVAPGWRRQLSEGEIIYYR